MPAFGVYPVADVLTAGDEVSSTYEGRHVTLLESELIHNAHADGLVDKGDPVVFGTVALQGVGVAFKSAVAATDYIAIDTEGIWIIDCYAADDGGNSAIEGGDRLYIANSTPCVVSKIATAATQVPFGYALGHVDAGLTETIAVKVHWDPIDPVTIYGDKNFAGAVSVSGSLNALEHFTVAYDATIRRDLSVLQHFSVAYNAVVGNDLTVVGHLGALRAHIGNGATFTGVVTNLTVEDGIVTAAS